VWEEGLGGIGFASRMGFGRNLPALASMDKNIKWR